MGGKRKQEVLGARYAESTPLSQTRGACVACAWADCHRKRPTRNEGAHHVSHTTTRQKTGHSQTAPSAHCAERLQRDHAQAQRAIEALEQALHDVGLPNHLVKEIEGRLRRQQTLLGKIFGLMFPPLFGCRTPYELSRVRGWDKHLGSHILGALPKRSWLKQLRRLGLEVLEPLWRQVQDKSAATQSRWRTFRTPLERLDSILVIF